MFFAQTLKKKLDSEYESYLNNNQDCLFLYKNEKNKNTTLLAELKNTKPKFTHIKLKKMTPKDYLKNFTKKNLTKKWERKCEVNFSLTTNKFNQKLDKKKTETKHYIKNLVDKDIFKIKQPRWNNSTKPSDNNANNNFKEYLRQIKYEAEHYIKNKITNHKLNQICNEHILIIHDHVNNGWNVSSKLEQKEKEMIDKELYIKSLNNTQKYWLKNHFNKELNNKFGNKSKKTLHKCNSAFMKRKTKDIMNSIIEEKKLKLFEENKDDSNDIYENYKSKQKSFKKSDSVDFFFKKKNMNISNIIKYKKALNQWKDKELIEKIKLIEEWNEPSIYCELNNSYKPDDLKQEMLKKLIYNKERIKKEQLKMKEAKKYKNLIRNVKKLPNNNLKSPLIYSKYPISYQQKSSMENKSEILNINPEISKEEDKSFIEAYQKIILEQNKSIKNKKGCLSFKNVKENIGKFIYIHPGVYREFTFINLHNNNNNEVSKNAIREEKYMAWSCCNNIDKNSKGCEKKYIHFEMDNSSSFI